MCESKIDLSPVFDCLMLESDGLVGSETRVRTHRMCYHALTALLVGRKLHRTRRRLEKDAAVRYIFVLYWFGHNVWVTEEWKLRHQPISGTQRVNALSIHIHALHMYVLSRDSATNFRWSMWSHFAMLTRGSLATISVLKQLNAALLAIEIFSQAQLKRFWFQTLSTSCLVDAY